MTIETELTGPVLADGAYLGLEDAIYFAQPRLGSSDVIRLSRDGPGWWWQSRHNPDREQKQTDAMNYGSALHKIMLEGMAAYESSFLVEPEKKAFGNGLLVTVDDMRNALDAKGLTPKPKPTAAADWAKAVANLLPGVPCWPTISAAFERTREVHDEWGAITGLMPSISAVEDRMLRMMLQIALDDPDARALVGREEKIPTLAEVSFFWTDELGVKRRARFDKPVPAFTLDLKSLGNWQGRELVHGIGDHILRSGYDIQVGDQQDARQRMHRMIREQGDEAIHGGTDEERSWLQAMAVRNYRWDWAWLFYQKPEPSGRAPIIFPLRERWRGPYHVNGYRKARRALLTYVECRDKFGLDQPWSRVEPLHFTEPVPGRPDLPIISLPNWGWVDYVPNEELHFDAPVTEPR